MIFNDVFSFFFSLIVQPLYLWEQWGLQNILIEKKDIKIAFVNTVGKIHVVRQRLRQILRLISANDAWIKRKYIKNKFIYLSFHLHANCRIFSLSLLISSRFFCSLYFLLISWISFCVLSMSNLYSLVFAWYMLICAASSFSLLVLVVRPLWRIDSFSATYRPGCFFIISRISSTCLFFWWIRTYFSTTCSVLKMSRFWRVLIFYFIS